ncbi:MAG: DUF2842 domain-containing protein [Hyphomicrobiaceae bacterium]|nr:DUF2842 domain-containing protein [Hyphomicrobiaceae bacterium]
MTRRTRKFLGGIALLAFIAAYAILAMAVGASPLIIESKSMQWLYFLIAGLAWVVPAGLLVRWMQKPDEVPD